MDVEEKILKLIKSKKNGILQNELWKTAKIDSSKCSRIVAKLEKEGLITKEINELNPGQITYLIKSIEKKEPDVVSQKSNNLEQVKQTRNELVEESIHPSSVNDQATKVDILGFEPYVKAIADFLTNKDIKPPLTLSIEGQWGTGKSSFMLQLKEILESRNQITVSFDAWRHDKEDALWAAFALDFLYQVSHKLRWHRRIFGDLNLLKYRLYWKNRWLDVLLNLAILIFIGYAALKVLPLQDIVKNAGYIIAIGVILLFIKQFKDSVGNPIDIDFAKYYRSPDYENRLAFLDNFHKDFKKIVDAYVGENKVVYVFIDDLDRCEVPKAADLMQALNLMITDDSSLIFIIGMDREKIAASFAVKHEKLVPYLFSMKATSEASATVNDQFKGLEYGYAFIEKFIQLPFLVPEPTKPDFQRLLEKISKSSHDNILSNKNEGRLSQVKNFLRRKISKATKPVSTEANSEQIPSKLTEEQKLRRERIRVAVTGDSQTIRDVALMVAPALDNNPRRLKQFINLFRLRTFIANETGLFDTLGDSSIEEGLALQQLGKFVVIILKWPLLLVELEANPSLLTELQDVALGRVPQKMNLSYWTNQQKLMDFLRSGCFNDDDTPNPEKEQYCSLSKLKINKLLQVSPRLVRPSPMLKPEVTIKSINEEQKTNVSNNEDLKRASNDPEQSEELITEETKQNHISDLKDMLRLWQQNLSSNKVFPAEETFTFGRLNSFGPSSLRDIENHALFEDIFHHFPDLRDFWNESKTLSFTYSLERQGFFDKIEELIKQKLKEHNFHYQSENDNFDIESAIVKGFTLSVCIEIVRITKGKNNVYDYSIQQVSVKGVEKTKLFYEYIGTGNGYNLAYIGPERIDEVKKIHKEMIKKCEEIYLSDIKKIIELENKTKDSHNKLKARLDEIMYLMRFPQMDCKFVK